jgi:peroxiredoxin Q/BCP
MLSSPAIAGGPGVELPGEPDDPERAPVQDSILPNIGDVPEVADLSPGDRAPDFKLHSSTSKLLQLSDLKGHMSVLIFGTDCTLFGPFESSSDSLTAMGVQQYGICPNSTHSVEGYASKARLDFPLLSDPNADVSERYGMYDTDNQAIQPGMIMIDPKGVILLVVQGSGLHPDLVPGLVRHELGAYLARTAGS